MLILARILARLRDRSGFTLIETLVAMVTGVIVTGALFAILQVSTRQSSHLSGVAQATQLGRTAMTRMVAQLHSACLSQGFAPVKKESSSTKLILVNGYDEKASEKEEPPAELAAASIHKDEIEYVKASGKLTDKRYTATSNVPSNGEYTWSTTTKTYVLAEQVAAPEPAGKEEPVFQYYAYATTPSTSSTGPASTLNEISLAKTEPLTETNYKTVAAVNVAFRVGPQGRKEYKQTTAVEKGVYTEQSTLTTFSFMAPNSEASISEGPCE